METEHVETVVDKAVAYVKDFFGVPPGDRTPDVEANPEYTDTAPEPTIKDAMRLDPHTRTLKIGAETNAERREDESANSAANEYVQAAGQIDRTKISMRKSLDDLNEHSYDIRAKAIVATKQALSPAERHSDGPYR
jgi:hypothetical protein